MSEGYGNTKKEMPFASRKYQPSSDEGKPHTEYEICMKIIEDVGMKIKVSKLIDDFRHEEIVNDFLRDWKHCLLKKNVVNPNGFTKWRKDSNPSYSGHRRQDTFNSCHQSRAGSSRNFQRAEFSAMEPHEKENQSKALSKLIQEAVEQKKTNKVTIVTRKATSQDLIASSDSKSTILIQPTPVALPTLNFRQIAPFPVLPKSQFPVSTLPAVNTAIQYLPPPSRLQTLPKIVAKKIPSTLPRPLITTAQRQFQIQQIPRLTLTIQPQPVFQPPQYQPLHPQPVQQQLQYQRLHPPQQPTRHLQLPEQNLTLYEQQQRQQQPPQQVRTLPRMQAPSTAVGQTFNLPPSGAPIRPIVPHRRVIEINPCVPAASLQPFRPAVPVQSAIQIPAQQPGTLRPSIWFGNATVPRDGQSRPADTRGFRLNQLDGAGFELMNESDYIDSDEENEMLAAAEIEVVGDGGDQPRDEEPQEFLDLDEVEAPTKEEIDQMYEADNLIICLYESMNYKKGKLKGVLKSGVVMAHNKEKFFNTAILNLTDD